MVDITRWGLISYPMTLKPDEWLTAGVVQLLLALKAPLVLLTYVQVTCTEPANPVKPLLKCCFVTGGTTECCKIVVKP